MYNYGILNNGFFLKMQFISPLFPLKWPKNLKKDVEKIANENLKIKPTGNYPNYQHQTQKNAFKPF